MRRQVYLDLDGVLHPADVLVSTGEAPRLADGQDGHTLFEHAQLLADVLADHQDVTLVLSTAWVRVCGLPATLARLPPSLAARVIGTTLQPGPGFASVARGYQVHAEVARRGVQTWIALDDDVRDWPEEGMEHVIATDPLLGISEPGALAKLRAWLEATKPLGCA